MERFFTTEGPIEPEWHYYVLMSERFEAHEVTALINQSKYFLMHAPRQTGKTSSLLAYMRYLNEQGKHHCVYASIEDAQGYRDNVEQGMLSVARSIASSAADWFNDSKPQELLIEILAEGTGINVFGGLSRNLCKCV